MKNSLIDLNNHLFETIERLNDEDLKEGNLEQEIKRAGSIANVAGQIIQNSQLMLKAAELKAEYNGYEQLPEMFVENKKIAVKSGKNDKAVDR